MGGTTRGAPGRLTRVVLGTVTDLQAQVGADRTVTLTWTAPGDDGHNPGHATQYVIWFSQVPIGAENLGDTTNTAQDLPAPAEAGETQQCRIPGLKAGEEYHFRMLAIDDVGNGSMLSNEATVNGRQ